MADKMSIDKKDPSKDDSEDSMGSSPEGEPASASNNTQEQPAKRKGGRKPVRHVLMILLSLHPRSWVYHALLR